MSTGVLSRVVWFGLFVLVCVGINESLSKEAEPAIGREVWSLDLRAAGYVFNETSPPEQPEAGRDIVIGDNGEVIVLGGRPDFENAYTVTGFVLNAEGKLVRSQTWPARYARSVVATAKGNYVVMTESGLAVYSRGLERQLASASRAAAFESPSGKSLGVRSARNGMRETVFLDSETLADVSLTFTNDHNVESISDDSITYATYLSRSRWPVIRVEDRSGVIGTYDSECDEVHSRFVAKDAVIVLGCGHMDVISLRGERVFREEINHGSWLAAVSREGRRFAMVNAKYSRGKEPKLMSEEFTIYDIPSRKALATVRIEDLKGRHRGRTGAALAGDGSSLAVNSLGMVHLYKLPE